LGFCVKPSRQVEALDKARTDGPCHVCFDSLLHTFDSAQLHMIKRSTG
jgi:hypothetical protein